ncbi:hypothetical protein GALMADRAFT_259458 [Galerina marginata CBS 339.88]|uniref:Aminoglycoside phosphotransferase domain-containing protein n=1 Tax=Galerina marginata (strain CBS 339.88) TaxID=685588 RepID=A0A067S6D2_GALM3|nr:hypothetical protein GALMADRAFT_259458 [Galerina marginata CBS 339.88]
MSPSASSKTSVIDTRVQITLDIVNWDALSSLGRKLLQADGSHWGEHISGGYNLVRFLHLHDSHNTTLVARVPLRSKEVMNAEHDPAISKRVASEVATMEYVEAHTNIPVPHVFHHSADADGVVRSPYIFMSKVEGVALSSVWDDMVDEKRRIILRQVIDVLLDLWSHRFEKKGVLFKRPGPEGKDGWYVESSSIIEDPDAAGPQDRLLTTSYTNAPAYWLACANANLRDIRDKHFGSISQPFAYAQAWFIRSLVPSLFDPSLDDHGFPLCPGDFHSQNILITDDDLNPRITAVIDWELSGPDFVTTFAMYPFFIVDHPAWDDDNPLRQRNKRDQATFDELILQAERNRNPVKGSPLSYLIANSYSVYLFQQTLSFPVAYSVFYPLLFSHVLGNNDDFSVDYYWSLMEQGILRKETAQFEKENKVWLEAQKILGKDVVCTGLTAGEFKDLVLIHLDEFDKEGIVCEWLASVSLSL